MLLKHTYLKLFFGLLVITCAFLYVFQKSILTKMYDSLLNISNQYTRYLRNELRRNLTEHVMGNKTVSDFRKTISGNISFSKSERYFRCANPIGRLGNMMFQLAATIGIAHTLRYTPYIKPSHSLEKYFDTGLTLDINITNEISLNDEKCRKRVWNTDEKYLSHNLTTWGYLQSWRYFENSTKEVRNAFTFKSEYLEKARAFLHVHTKPNNVLIGIHVRRGDFLSKKNTGLGYSIADGNYTKKAMGWHRMKSNKALFVVVSDDIAWCKSNIEGDDVIFSDVKEGILDLAILSLCHHSIITGGSFGWWGGWLAGGSVIFLDDFPRRGSWVWNNSETRDNYYPSNWIGMSNGNS